MIIDQLPEISSVQETDEIPVERGTTTYKATLGEIKELISPTETVYATLTCEAVSTESGTRNAWSIGSNLPPIGGNLTLTVRNASTGAVHVIWYYPTDSTFEVAATLVGNAPNVGDVIFVQYQA